MFRYGMFRYGWREIAISHQFAGQQLPFWLDVENVAEPDHKATAEPQNSLVNDESKLPHPLQCSLPDIPEVERRTQMRNRIRKTWARACLLMGSNVLPGCGKKPRQSHADPLGVIISTRFSFLLLETR
jgi:hypothetical protein